MSIGTSNYPTAVDDASSLGVPVDSFSTKSLQTTLAVNCLSTDVTLQLTATPASIGAPSSFGIVSIDDEEITYTGVSGSNLTGCIRHIGGTSAVGHTAGTIVKFRYVALFDKAIQAAVIALQTTLGVTGSFNFLANLLPLVVDYVNNFVGVDVASGPVLAPLQVGSAPDGSTTIGSQPVARICGTSLNNTVDQVLLRLLRDTNSGNLYGGSVDFRIKSYVGSMGSPYLPKTQLVIALKSGATGVETADKDVLRLKDDGTVEVLVGPLKFPDGTTQTTAASGSSGSVKNLFSDISFVTSSNTTATVNIFNWSIPANTVATNGDVLEVNWMLTGNNISSGSNCTFTLGVNIDTFSPNAYWTLTDTDRLTISTLSSGPNTNVWWKIRLRITRDSSSSCIVVGEIDAVIKVGSITFTYTRYREVVRTPLALSAGFWTSARSLQLTGQMSVAASSCIMQGQQGSVDYYAV